MTDRLWNWLTSIRLCFWVLNLLSLNLVIGGFYASIDDRYCQLNSKLFFSWLINHLDINCWWLFTLMMVLLLLGVNTLACSCKRIKQLWQRRYHNRLTTSLLLLCPTMMHLCFLLILSGHALTEFSGLKEKMSARKGEQTMIQRTLVEVIAVSNLYYSAGPLAGHLQCSSARLKFTDKVQNKDQFQIELVAVLSPIWHNGITYHLALDGKPESGQEQHLVVNIKQDTGLPLILLGNGLMCLLLLIYFLGVRNNYNGGRL